MHTHIYTYIYTKGKERATVRRGIRESRIAEEIRGGESEPDILCGRARATSATMTLATSQTLQEESTSSSGQL